MASGLTAVLERHGGKLAASDSEHLMGVFGVATLHEDDALRAARASLEAREALTAEAGVAAAPLRRQPGITASAWRRARPWSEGLARSGSQGMWESGR